MLRTRPRIQRPSAIIASWLLLAFLVFPRTLPAEEEAERDGPRCAIPAALLDTADPRLWQIYDGVRKGLEAAQLPRVCVENLKDDEASFAWLGGELDEDLAAPVAPLVRGPIAFAFGERAADRMAVISPRVPRVFALLRYTIKKGREVDPLQPLPRVQGLHGIVFARIPVGWVGNVLQRLLAAERPRVAIPWKTSPWKGSAVQLAQRRAIEEAGGFRFVGLDEKPDVLLHCRLGVGGELDGFRTAVIQSRKLKVPLVSDDPARFGLGAHVILVPDLELVGRVAAEAARRLDRAREQSLPPRPVQANRVWVDLEAMDRSHLSLPLSFLASAYKLRRGLGVGPSRASPTGSRK